MRVLLWCLVACVATGVVVLTAQDGPAQGPLDPVLTELVAAWVQQDAALGQVVIARAEAMVKTPEGQAYQKALQARLEAQTRINQQLATRMPGYALDFRTGTVHAPHLK